VKPDLPLDKMTVEEKLMTMEAIWDSLSREPEAVASPPWHGEVLAERLAALERGDMTLLELDEVKRRIREQTR
jgi:putative addiction module component (TIGR02574 family)